MVSLRGVLSKFNLKPFLQIENSWRRLRTLQRIQRPYVVVFFKFVITYQVLLSYSSIHFIFILFIFIRLFIFIKYMKPKSVHDECLFSSIPQISDFRAHSSS